jgi:hypothetical protein
VDSETGIFPLVDGKSQANLEGKYFPNIYVICPLRKALLRFYETNCGKPLGIKQSLIT